MQSALAVMLKEATRGLISIILILVSTVGLPFQGGFAPVCLRPVLGMMPAYVLVSVWSSSS